MPRPALSRPHHGGFGRNIGTDGAAQFLGSEGEQEGLTLQIQPDKVQKTDRGGIPHGDAAPFYLTRKEMSHDHEC